MTIDHFTTARLSIRSWLPDVKEAAKRRSLEAALSGILTDRVLAHLPPPLQLGQGGDDIAAWVDARRAESDVLLVFQTDPNDLIGLLIIAPDTSSAEVATVHFGYLLAETVWGQGLATELVSGLVSAMATRGPVQLIGGVDRANTASARVLSKAGFEIDEALSTEGIDLFVRMV